MSPPRTPWRIALGVPVAVLTLAIAVAVAVGGRAAPTAEPPHAAPTATEAAGQAAPLDLADLPPRIAGHYRHAKANAAVYRQLPCYCGCEKFLGHRDLYDCFVRADGAGWEAHATGCGICIAESVTARRLLDAGASPAAVRAAVVAEFGATTGTTPSALGAHDPPAADPM